MTKCPECRLQGYVSVRDAGDAPAGVVSDLGDVLESAGIVQRLEDVRAGNSETTCLEFGAPGLDGGIERPRGGQHRPDLGRVSLGLRREAYFS